MQSANSVIAPAAFAYPRPVAPAAFRRCLAPARRDYGLADVAAKLGILHLAQRTIIDQVRSLVEHEGFPAPRTVRLLKGRMITGARSVTAKSRWDVEPVDAWDDRAKSPPETARRDASARELSRQRLADRVHLIAANQ